MPDHLQSQSSTVLVHFSASSYYTISAFILACSICIVIADCSGSLNASRLLLLLGTSPVRPEVPLPRASTDVTFLFDTSSTSPCPGCSFISAWHKRLTVPICGLYKVTCNEGGAEASTIIG